MNRVLAFTGILYYSWPQSGQSGPCLIPVSSLPPIEPLYLLDGSTNLVRGDTAGMITLQANQKILLACPGTKLDKIGTSEAVATCVGGVQLSVGGKTYNAGQLGCIQWPTPTSWLGGKCMVKNRVAKMGYLTSVGNVELIEACHDLSLHNSIYVTFTLWPEAVAYRRGIPRGTWMKGNLFNGVTPDNLYSRVTERATFGTLLGSVSQGAKYINLVNDYFLSKGHLAAKADFFYGTGQMATFFYANALPQWQTFNGGNWNILEDNVRLFVSQYGKPLTVYTGGSVRASLPNVNNVQSDLFLTTNRLMPVPRMFWKILYDPTTQAGIAFIGLNNPYQTLAEAKADVRCKDISSQVSWLTWQQTNLVQGFSYTCEVNDFYAKFPGIPKLKVKSILK